jgi:tRNA(Ile)-lysidine synthase
METRFNKYISANALFDKSTKVLAAVSGGVDSVVLVELLKRAGMDFGIAHCNFQLRDDESEADEAFVKRLAKDCGVAFHVKRFETSEYARKGKLSVQMAARALRYDWFEKVRLKDDYGVIATAHHLDDSVETFFLNLVRGTGIRGLSGIEPKNGNVVRPLLFAKKDDIITYASQANLTFREDASNVEDKYNRNFIRHNVIPQLEKLNPAFVESMQETMGRLAVCKEIYQQAILELKADIVEEGATVKLNIAKLNALSSLNHILFELISKYGFTSSDVSDIAAALDGAPGKRFFSGSHRLIKDRDYLLIDPIDRNISEVVTIEEGTTNISKPIALTFELRARDGLVIPRSDRKACLDHAKLKYPLTLRNWTEGDSMQPLGMVGRKKLSDIFIDQKIPLNEKENIFVLESEGEIAWVVGHKIDDRFKTTDATEQVYLIELSNGE